MLVLLFLGVSNYYLKLRCFNMTGYMLTDKFSRLNQVLTIFIVPVLYNVSFVVFV